MATTVDEIANHIKVELQRLDEPFTDKQLKETAKLIPNLRLYCEALELTEQEITCIQESKKPGTSGYYLSILDCLRTWSNKYAHTPKGTVRHLMQTCINLGNAQLAGEVCKVIKQNDKTSDLQNPPVSDLEQPLYPKEYREYLSTCYKRQVLGSSNQWPPTPTKKIFKLALIKKEKIQRGRIDDDFIQATITGKIDDILQEKVPIELGDIFSESEDGRKFVLIEGAPGSGKSTLAVHICQEWAKGKLFQEYELVILVRLGDPLVRKAQTVADLLPSINKAMANEAEAAMLSQFGKHVLWVLDGWDELSSDLPADSIVNKLVLNPTKLGGSPLHSCDIIVTSRPTSSAKLQHIASARVEVLGFTPTELEEYFAECLREYSHNVQTLLEMIRDNPVIKSTCYLPLVASILIHLYLSGGHTLSKSNHGIFASVVTCILSHYMQKQLCRESTQTCIITSLNDLPRDLQSAYNQLCQLAYLGVIKNQLTFNTNDLQALHISTISCGVGLLQAIPSLLVDRQEVYYSFLHLSIQEFLAAVYITCMSSQKQIATFQNLFPTPRFAAVFEFYAGISKLNCRRSFLSRLPKWFLRQIPRDMRGVVSSIIRDKSKPLLISLLRCLYEAQDLALTQFVVEELESSLVLSHTTLSPIDCLSVGYFISVVCLTTRTQFLIKLDYCSFANEGCMYLHKGVQSNHSSSRVTTSGIILDFRGNDIDENGIPHLIKILKTIEVVRELNLSSNPNIGPTGLKLMCPFLVETRTMTGLYLYNCSILITDDNAPAIIEMLRENTSLKGFSLSGNRGISDCRCIAAGLKQNTSVTKFSLSCCALTDQSLEQLSEGLNDHIEELFIYDNKDLTENGLENFASHLTRPKNLKILSVPVHLSPHIETVFGFVNERRKGNGLPEIRVKIL